MNNQSDISKSRLIVATAIIILSLLSATFIPLVYLLPLPNEFKLTLSGLLVFGIPQLLMATAIAIVGKKGYQYIKKVFFKLIKSKMPPDSVSKRRYTIGLIMFIIPLVLAWVHPIALHFFPSLIALPIWYFFSSDALLIASFFVLGGDFWDKFSGLFKYEVKITKTP